MLEGGGRDLDVQMDGVSSSSCVAMKGSPVKGPVKALLLAVIARQYIELVFRGAPPYTTVHPCRLIIAHNYANIGSIQRAIERETKAKETFDIRLFKI